MSSGRTCAIVPVKALGRAKRRLSSVLPEAARQRLVLTMLEDVLAALAGVESIDCVIVVTPDARVAALAQEPRRDRRAGAGRRGAERGDRQRHRLCLLARRRPGPGAAGRRSPHHVRASCAA